MAERFGIPAARAFGARWAVSKGGGMVRKTRLLEIVGARRAASQGGGVVQELGPPERRLRSMGG